MPGKSLSYHSYLHKWIFCQTARLLYCLLFCLCIQGGFAQSQPAVSNDEISVDLYIRDIGSISISVIIRNEKAWLSIPEVFDFLKINHINSPGGDTLGGFFISTDNNYFLDAKHNRFQYRENTILIPPLSMIVRNKMLYLRSDLFNTLFKLDCRFDYRSLSVNLFTTLELPVAKEKKQEMMRNNIGKLRNEQKADTIMGPTHVGLRLGMIDWSINTIQDFKNISETQANIAFGGVIAGGETTVALQYNSRNIFSPRQQYYLWRHIDNDNNLLRQISVGKINTNATSSIFAAVIGVQFSNSPTIFRRSFGTYRLNRYTQPGWMAELYVNNVLVDYTKADASGFYGFDVPVVYGNTQIQVKYYGPNGEQRMGEGNIIMPYTFLPVGKLEYNISAGIVEDGLSSKVYRAQFNYGLLNRITIGAGVEYLSSILNPKVMPFIKADFRVSRNMLFTSEYMQGVRSNITGTYRLPSNMLFEVNYIAYTKGQQAIYNTYLEERRAAVSFPLRLKNFNAYTRFSFYQIVLPGSEYTTAEALFSGLLLGVSTNFTTYALFTDNNNPYLYSNLSLAIRLPGKILIMPQAQYEYNRSRFISVRGELEKRVSSRGYINGYYERNFKSDFRSINIGIRYEFTHTIAGFSVRKSTGNELALISSLSGSTMHDSRTGYTKFTNIPGVGRGGLVISAFVDLNNNGKKDKGEPKVSGLRFAIGGGYREENKKDTSTVVRNLEAYNSFLVTIDKNSFDEIAWKIKLGVVKVEIGPNQFRQLEIPITVLGEVSGTIYIQTVNGKKPLERMLINIYNNNRDLIAQTLSEIDGYYSYLGLPPGSFTIQPDPEQMQKLGLQFQAREIHIMIEGTYYGDVIRNIDLSLLEQTVKTEK